MHLSKNLVLKRVILLLAFITFSSVARSTDYYISSSGNDVSNTGLSPSSPWKTIAKANSLFPTLRPGDRILFKRGDVFYGGLRITASGVSGNPIIISAFGTGEKPLITGLTTISDWKDEGNGIYSSSVKCQSALEMVLINNVQYGMGRFPNTSWLTVDSHTGDISISDSELNSNIINWKGAEIVQRKGCSYVMDRYKIAGHSGNTLTYNGAGTYLPSDGWGYFVQNDIRTLDSSGEWYYNITTSVFSVFFGPDNPGNNKVQISTVDNLISFSSENQYVTIDNISFRGANKNAIYCYRNNNITIQNCNIDFSGNNGIWGVSSQNLVISNSKINYSNVSGIRIGGLYCHNSRISGNTVMNTGLIPGMGDFHKTGTGIAANQGNNIVIEFNHIQNSGHCGIIFGGTGSTVSNNYISNFCMKLEDGGGIYYGGQAESKNMLIKENIILYGSGAPGGKPEGKPSMAAGIYLDYNTTGGVRIISNTIAHINWNGIYLHGCQNVEITGNSVFNAVSCFKSQEYEGVSVPARNLTMIENIYFAKDPKQYPLFVHSTNNDFDQFGYFNNNYYARPLDNAKPILPSVNWSGTPKTLKEWQTLYGHDPDSKISPVALTDTADIDFYFNPSAVNKEFALTQPMIDVTGTKHTSKIILAPYTSIILMKDPSPDQPVIPSYISSVIQNSTPDKLEITFSTTLSTNPLPPVTAFTVQVNGNNRKVTSLTVTGSKIILTLESPVIFGDNVTFTYTQPNSSGLQTPSGSLAKSTAELTVKNNLFDPAVHNGAPVISLKYVPTTFSGFVYEIDASGTTDPDSDIITFSWEAPYSVPVSGTTDSKIRFLAPVVKKSEILTFVLNASDGRVTSEKIIEINLLPYKPEIAMLKVSGISASSYYKSYYPGNVTDENPTTRWSVEGDNQWLQFDLPVPCKISHLQVAFLTGQKYESYFDIYASKDNIIWTPVALNAVSCDFSGSWQVFNFPEDNHNTEFSYVKLVGNGNSSDKWNNISGLRIFGNDKDVDSKSYYNSGEITLYPNPVSEFINVLILEPSSDSQSLRIYNSSGKLCLEETLETGGDYFQISITLKPGIYIAKILQAGLITHTQKLIVV